MTTTAAHPAATPNAALKCSVNIDGQQSTIDRLRRELRSALELSARADELRGQLQAEIDVRIQYMLILFFRISKLRSPVATR